jgi:beta-lactamase regulating signal transducer with metallopeptidase domain
VIELVCYYGPKDYNVVDQGQRDAFIKFLDDTSKSNSNANASSTTASSQSSGTASQSSLKTTFQKYKLYIFGAAGAVGLLVVLAAVFIAVRRGKPSNRVTPTRMSVESDFETMTSPSETA